jgi:hypothetical protein
VNKIVNALNEKSADSGVAGWAANVAERLRENAMPVFDRSERPTPEKATTIRMAALCLAGEADGIGRADLGNMFRQVAVEITLLEKRATDARYAREVIMLAVDGAVGQG